MPIHEPQISMDARISSLEVRIGTLEQQVGEIRGGLIGGPSTPGAYEQIRRIDSTVASINQKFDHQMVSIMGAVDSYKQNIWYIRGLVAAVALVAAGSGWAFRLFLDWFK